MCSDWIFWSFSSKQLILGINAACNALTRDEHESLENCHCFAQETAAGKTPHLSLYSR